MGQKKTVRVFQLIAENTIEAKVLDIRASSGCLNFEACKLICREAEGCIGRKGE